MKPPKQPPINESIPCTCETKAAVCGRCIYCGHLKGAEMAKRTKAAKVSKTPKPRQTMIPGTIDEPPPVVREAADAYLTAKRSIAKFREKMNDALADLIEKMKAADVLEFLIDDGEKKLILTEKDQIKIKARKKSKDDPAPDPKKPR